MTTPTPSAEEFRRRVEEAASGTPYVVTATGQGFDVALDIADAEWFGRFNEAGLDKQYIHHVSVPGDGTYTITDDARTVEWVAGVPQLAASAGRQYGRVIELSFQKEWEFNEHGRLEEVVDVRFSSVEGRRLVTGVADQLGLTARRGAVERTALVGAALAVVTVLVVGVAALLGRF